MGKRLRRLGIEKIKNFNENFDEFYDKYKNKAINEGYNGDLVFDKERGKVIVFVVL